MNCCARNRKIGYQLYPHPLNGGLRGHVFRNLLVALCCAAVGYAQNSTSPEQGPVYRPIMSPVPFWPSNGAQPDLAGKTGVFFDLSQRQVVILTPNATSSSGYKQLRYGVANGADATVTFSLQPSGAGTTKYSYYLTDNAQSRQPSQRLAILLPSHDSTIASPPSPQVSGASWAFGTEQTTIPDRTSTVAFGTMQLVYWSNPAPTGSKVVGLTASLTSAYLPGFADAFVEGLTANPISAQALAGLPADVVAQAGMFLQPGIGSSPSMVMGPLFRPGADKLVIASDYYFGVTRLVHAGQLKQNSAYTGALLSALELFLQNGGAGPLKPPAVAPSGPLESTIQQGAALAFK